MAVPVVAANSPQVGYISWQSFSIQYQGTLYLIPAGNTAEKWVWWRYNGGGGASVVEAGADLPADLSDDDLVLLVNRNGTPFRVQSANFIDGDMLVDGSVSADALAANAVTTDHLLAGDALIGALEVTGDVVAAQVETNGLKIGTGTWNVEGFDIPDVVHFPVTAGSGDAEVTAHLTARSLTIENYFSLRGQINSIQTGARMVLDSGVSNPATAPTNVAWWSSEKLSSAGDVTGKVGLEQKVVNGVIYWYTLVTSGGYVYIEEWSDGVRLRSKVVYGPDWGGGNSVAKDLVLYENNFYTLHYDTWLERYQVYRTPADLSLSGYTTNRSWDVGTGNFSSTKDPALYKGRGRSIDSFDLRILGSDGGDIKQATLTFNAGNSWAMDGTIQTNYAQHLGGVVYKVPPPGFPSSTADYVMFPQTQDPRPYDGTAPYTITYLSGEAFPRASGRNVMGACTCPYAEASYSTIDQYGTIWHYTNARWNNDVAYTWYDSDPAGTGLHETTFSPRKTITGYGGAFMDLGTPPPPDNGSVDGADSVGIYKSSTVGGSLARVQYLAPGATSLRIRPDTAASGTPTTDFSGANQTSGEIRSTGTDGSGPIIALRGDGSGRIGGHEWTSSGEATTRPGFVGELAMYAGTTAPKGWTVCDGRAVGRTDPVYARLFAVIGTTYGAGDGSTTFNLPDMRGRFPLGGGPGIDGTTRNAGWKGGQMTLTEANMPAHTHTINHDHPNASVAMRSAAGGSTAPVRGNATADGSASVNIPSYSGSSGSTGSGSAFLPPSQAVNYAIKL